MGMMQQAAQPPEAAARPATPAAPPEAEEPVESPQAPEEEADDTDGEEASPEEQAEYERAMAGLYEAMYQNPKSSRAILDMIQAEDKIGSVAKAVVLLVEQLDKKIQLDEAVVPQITQDAAERVVEMAERGKKIQFSEQELQAIAGASLEGVMQVFGASPEDAQQFMSSMPPEQQAKVKQGYEQMVAGNG